MRGNCVVACFSAIGVLVASATWAQATCNQSSSSAAEQDLWNTHGCWNDYFLWSYKAYKMRRSDFIERGWNDACNINKEFAKHWNASYLITYGLADNNEFSFHGTGDYRGVAEARSSSYHSSFYHDVDDGTSPLGKFVYNPFTTNEIVTLCGLYTATFGGANPAARAGVFMHEGWHGWLSKYDWSNGSCSGHHCGPTGNCTKSNCDYFYFHGIGAFAFGQLWKGDPPEFFHTPYQLQVEFLCDVSDYPQSWVPASVRLAAQAHANARAADRFINGPGYFCGAARPW